MKMSEKNVKTVCEVTAKEMALLEFIRKLDFGEMKLYVSEGQPVRLEEIKKSVKL